MLFRPAPCSAVLCCVIMLLSKSLAAQPAEPPKRPAWLGVSMELSTPLPPDDRYTATQGVSILTIAAGSPAERAGLQPGDILLTVGGEAFAGDSAEWINTLRGTIAAKQPGDTLQLNLFRQAWQSVILKDGAVLAEPPAEALHRFDDWVKQQPDASAYARQWRRQSDVLELTVTLAERSAGFGGHDLPPDTAIAWTFNDAAPPMETLAAAVVAQYGIADSYTDLRRRLTALTERGDYGRRNLMTLAHRHPYRAGEITKTLFAELASPHAAPPDAAILSARRLLDCGGIRMQLDDFRTGIAPEAHLDQLQQRLEAAQLLCAQAFAGLTAEEAAFARARIPALMEAFESQIYIDADEDAARRAGNLRLAELAGKIRYEPLMDAAFLLSSVWHGGYVESLRADLAAAGLDLSQPVVLQRDTAAGRIVIGGIGNDWYKSAEQISAALLIDLGGDDFYSNAAAASAADRPVAIVIDRAGNDAYESTVAYAQGCGLLGIGMLIDMAGDDSYIGMRACQGAGILGIGLLADVGGNDTYRAHAYAQACGFFGAGLLCDDAGNDSYESHLYGQSTAIAGGASILHDGAGDDRYYCKGTHASGYGTEGIWEGWGQGCGVGLRGLVSGGIALLRDGGGVDVMEAGNFSQGCGYYFGWGLLSADGPEDDVYIGSHYNMGACAHEAAGAFFEAGGHDTYITRFAVSAGLAWDESVTWFEDRAGNDRYPARNFCLGAAAHNAIVVWIDGGGDDTALGDTVAARTYGNDYHGGVSLTLALDHGGGTDVYPGVPAGGMSARKEYGFFFDLPGGLDGLLREGALSTLAAPLQEN